jgi:hypothetical protein
MKAAPVYARELNWRVVPLHDVTSGVCSCSKGAECRTAGKHPRIRDWETLASNDLGVIAEWVDRWPSGNLGIATGEASGFFVLDVDPEHGGDATLEALEAVQGPLPKTVQAQTGSGGTHYLFRIPAGTTITNSAGKVGKGLDVRGDGGQIVVAPSISSKGPYRWTHAPFDTEIADAPPWLLEKLSAAPERKSQAPGVDITLRGTFPAASPEVLDEARQALELHGPAIDGDGGGLHAVTAASILTHDFALTDEEAWPLFVEWNETNDPPFDADDDSNSEDSLRERLRRGRKYGKREYGCKRALDSVESAKKVIADWQTAGAVESQMWEVIERVRKLSAHSGDTAKRAVMARELTAATGVPIRDLSIPAPRVEREPLEEGQIMVTTALHEVADAAIAAMADEVFCRNGVLCEVVKQERTFISDLEQNRILDLMSQTAVWVRHDDAEGMITQAPPDKVAAILHARRTHPLRVLEAITTAPIFLADGTILQERGYNEQARVFLEPNVEVNVPDEPDKEDAKAAAKLLLDLLHDFKFASKADKSSWLAALLSPLVKAATKNAPCPLICVSASTAGAGKTLLTNLIAQIVTGQNAEVSPYNPRDPSEWGKRLTAFVKMASPVRVLDNVNGPIGDEGLDRLITSSTWSDRILGASEAPPLPNVTVWMATGNNIEPHGDTARRVLMVREEVDDERPQERSGFKYNLEGGYALEHRSELLSAALTILRAYHLADRPEQDLPSWGSFTVWSALVRGALVWIGMEDPFLTQQRASADLNEPENDAHDFWLGVVGTSDGLPASIVTLANSRGAKEALGAREDITVLHLRKFIGRFVDKPRAGKRIRKHRDGEGQTTYSVETI